MAKRFSPTLSELRDTVAGTIAGSTKAYNLVEVCKSLGLPGGTDEEAWASKAKYVGRRIDRLDRDEIIRLAREVLGRWDSFALRESLRLFLCDNQPRITQVTRQRLYDELAVSPPLTGRMSVAAFLGELMPVKALPSPEFRFSTFLETIVQHTERNDDWDNAQILDQIGIRTASDEFVFEFLALLASPMVREGVEQSKFVAIVNSVINADGFALEETDSISGVPVFQVSCHGTGVRGRPKNLIFASNGPKPEILLADAVNNDIAIASNAEFVLVYDRPLMASGLTWTELVNWWKTHPSADLDNPERSLFLRLRESLGSVPEEHFFIAYYTVFKERLSNWPALIPQVYLHYDPKTIRELAGRKRFIHQRMDFLLLLPNRIRVVVEIDGKQHYADDSGKASPMRYSEMMRADRTLRLRGYELYRFGAAEFPDVAKTREVVRHFFDALMERHQIASGSPES